MAGNLIYINYDYVRDEINSCCEYILFYFRIKTCNLKPAPYNGTLGIRGHVDVFDLYVGYRPK